MKKLKFVPLVLAVVLLFTACDATKLLGQTAPKAQLLDDTEIITVTSQTAFNRLGEEAQQVYREICTVVQTQQNKITLSSVDTALIDSAFQAVFVDHPEYFYVDGYQLKTFGKKEQVSYVEFYPSYTIDQKEIEWRSQKINSAVEGIVGMAKDLPDDYSKAKFVYETIIRTTDYEDNSPDSQNVYSVFNNHKSVCAGYARAMQMVLNALGVECTYVIGTNIDGGPHAWNMAKLDGEYYHIDATFGDPVFTNAKGVTEQVVDEDTACDMPNVFYEFFAMTDEMALKTRSISEGQGLPVATSLKANYFVREGCYFDSYSMDALRPAFLKALEQNKNYVSLQFANTESYETAIRALFLELDVSLLMTDCRAEGHFMVNPDLVTYFRDPETMIITVMLY